MKNLFSALSQLKISLLGNGLVLLLGLVYLILSGTSNLLAGFLFLMVLGFFPFLIGGLLLSILLSIWFFHKSPVKYEKAIVINSFGSIPLFIFIYFLIFIVAPFVLDILL